ncbi:MAG: hypothetical protein ACXAEX_22945 [Promethearchaeota archaeon]
MINLEQISRKPKAQMIPLHVKVELLKNSIEETQKYELLTTNQYILQMEQVIEILEDISLGVRVCVKKSNPNLFGADYD